MVLLYITSIVEYSRDGGITEECQESIVEVGRDVLVRKMTRRRDQPGLLHWGFLSSLPASQDRYLSGWRKLEAGPYCFEL